MTNEQNPQPQGEKDFRRVEWTDERKARLQEISERARDPMALLAFNLDGDALMNPRYFAMQAHKVLLRTHTLWCLYKGTAIIDGAYEFDKMIEELTGFDGDDMNGGDPLWQYRMTPEHGREFLRKSIAFLQDILDNEPIEDGADYYKWSDPLEEAEKARDQREQEAQEFQNFLADAPAEDTEGEAETEEVEDDVPALP